MKNCLLHKVGKSYADQRRREYEFQIGEHVFLKVSPSKGIMKFKKKGKLSPKFIRLFKILRKIGDVAYELTLPLDFPHVHNVFNVSMLRRYMHVYVMYYNVNHLKSGKIYLMMSN